jgi:nitrogen fixation/metabolism regulation signal transduction histidine kinase
MTELRKVRARKISSPSSFLIFPPSRQKNRKTAIRGKRKYQNVKNTEIRVLVGVRHYMQATVGEYWDSWFSSISCSSQALFAHKKNSEKNKKTHQKIQKKRANTNQKNSLRLSLLLLLLLLLAVSIRIARDWCRAREIEESATRMHTRTSTLRRKGTRRLRSLSL